MPLLNLEIEWPSGRMPGLWLVKLWGHALLIEVIRWKKVMHYSVFLSPWMTFYYFDVKDEFQVYNEQGLKESFELESIS